MLKGSLPEVFLDTDVSFDILSKREPHFRDSAQFLELAAEDKISILIAESSLANLIYLSFDIYKIEDAASKLLDLIISCNIINGGKSVMMRAINSEFKDKEDALQYYTALNYNADYFITRNIKDFKPYAKILPVMTPKEFISSINA